MKIYHHNDLDGRCAAAITLRAKNSLDAELIEVDYNMQIIVAEIDFDEEIIIVDFSFKPEVMRKVLKRTERIIWIDHHKTAANYEVEYGQKIAGLRDFSEPGLSGCELAWQFFYTRDVVPTAVMLIGDRDTWRWEHGEHTAHFFNGMLSVDNKPESSIWDTLLSEDAQADFATEAITERGKIVIQFRDRFVTDYCNNYGFETEFEGYRCFAVGMYMFGSKVFGERFEQYEVCMAFEFDGAKWIIGLYSTTIDVAEIAKKRGGGGHTNAAGFTCAVPPFEGW